MTDATTRDYGRCLWLEATGLATRLLPAGADRRAARLAAILPGRSKARQQAELARRLFPDGFPNGDDPDSLPHLAMSHRLEEAMMIRRLARAPDWRPPLDCTGLTALKSEMALGGVMLWCCPQRFNMLLASLALHDGGFDPMRLSHWTHGPAATDTPSEFAQNRINAPWQAVENHFAERLVIGPGNVRKPMTAYAKALRGGRLLIVNAIPPAVNPAALPVPHGVLKLASGAARSALSAGAAIWTSVLRRDAGGVFHMDFAPLAPREAATDLPELLQQMALRSHAAIAADPALWIIAGPQLVPETEA